MTGRGAGRRIAALVLALCLLPALGVAAMAGEPVSDPPAHAGGQAGAGVEYGQAQPELSDSPESFGGQAVNEQALPPTATPTTLGHSSGQAGDGAALLELLEGDPGGVITLTGEVKLDSDVGWLYLRNPVTVDTGPYTVTVDTDLSIGGPVTFTGSGTVIRVAGNGYLGLGGQGAVTANGDGAIALYLEQGGGSGQDAPVRANGTGATAIYAEGDREFEGVEATATGSGSIGIHTTGSATLLLSFVRGGSESVVSDTREITMEGGGARPMPMGATAIPLHGTHDQEEHFITAVGNRPIGFELWEEAFGLSFVSKSGMVHGVSYPAILDESRVDYHTPGTYPVTGKLVLPFATDLMTWDPLEFTVTVLQSDRPQITKASLMGEDSLLLHLLEEIPEAWWIRVWCSDDGGDSWRDLDEEGMVTAEPGAALQIQGLPDDVTYRFYLEVWGGPLQGISNTLEFYADPDDRQGGGEREGDSDGEDHTLPPVTQPPGGESSGGGGTVTAPTGREGSTRRGIPTGGRGADADPVKHPEPPQVTPPVEQEAVAARATPQTPEPERETVAAVATAREEPVEAEPPAYPEDTSVWSADKLALMAANYPRQITFHCGGLSADLPTDALLEAVNGGDFAILLEQPSDSLLRIRFYTGGSELEELGGASFRVTFSAPGEQRALWCVGERGEPAEVMRNGAKASVTLTHTGDYVLEPKSEEGAVLPLTAEGLATPAESEIAAEAATGLPVRWMILPAAVLFAAVAGILLYRKRRAARE